METVYFKEWLPDVPMLGNTGLTEAKNVLPIGLTYKSFAPLVETSSAVPATVKKAYRLGALVNQVGAPEVIVGAGQFLYRSDGAGWTVNSSTISSGIADWQFTTYDDLVIAVNAGATLPMYRTMNSTSNFAFMAVGSPTSARYVGTISQFVLMAGGFTEPATLRWSSIDQPLNWPTPGSTTAIASQAGQQDFDQDFGEVTGIGDGDQFGLVFQDSAVNRVTYIGGQTVFQFNRISAGIGCFFPGSLITVAGLTYFMSRDGLYATDGAQVLPIGKDKINQWLKNLIYTLAPEKVTSGHDPKNKLICWNFPESSSIPTHQLWYNYEDGRFTHSEMTCRALVGGGNTLLEAFDGSNKLGYFPRSSTLTGGSNNTAVMETGEVEINVGGLSRVNGVKPLIDQFNVSVALGSRNDQYSDPTYSLESEVYERTGVANFRNEARYHRARLSIRGTFNSAQGVEFDATLSGSV